MEGEVPGGESQLLPGVSRRPGGERDHDANTAGHTTASRASLPLCSSSSVVLHQTFIKGVPPRQKLLPTGGAALTTEEKYMAMVDRCFPDDSSECDTHDHMTGQMTRRTGRRRADSESDDVNNSAGRERLLPPPTAIHMIIQAVAEAAPPPCFFFSFRCEGGLCSAPDGDARTVSRLPAPALQERLVLLLQTAGQAGRLHLHPVRLHPTPEPR